MYVLVDVWRQDIAKYLRWEPSTGHQKDAFSLVRQP